MSKKVIPLICEGRSDLIALEDYLNDLFKDKEIKFVVASGDVLGKNENYDKYLDELIENAIYKNDNFTPDFTLDDILMVAHLIDTDGIFESDDIVCLDKTLTFTNYFDDKICVIKDVIATRKTREKRRERINDCIKTSAVTIKNKTLPYAIYYMSTNLEHVTQNDRNIETDIEKIKLAEEFSTRFNNSTDFLEFLNANNKSNTLDFQQSWDYVRNNSLSKCTNLIIFVYKFLNQNDQKG